ncbi:MAG: DUF4010 domain-containing protein, partial [Reyranella sp.]|nr:DUF4010 domain-containing protein [Reyranella sp.]
MGSRARAEPQLRGAAVAGAALSSVATVAKLLLVVGVTNVALLGSLAFPLLLPGAARVPWGRWST